MTVTRRIIEIEPDTTAEELFRLVREANGDVDLKFGDRVFEVHLHSVETGEAIGRFPVMRTRGETKEISQKANDLMTQSDQYWDRSLVTDERTGKQRYVVNRAENQKSADNESKHDVEAFVENLAAFGELVDFEKLATSIKESRRFDIEQSQSKLINE